MHDYVWSLSGRCCFNRELQLLFWIKEKLLIICLKKDGLRRKGPVRVIVSREGLTGKYTANEPRYSFGRGGNGGLHSWLSCTLLAKSGQSMLDGGQNWVVAASKSNLAKGNWAAIQNVTKCSWLSTENTSWSTWLSSNLQRIEAFGAVSVRAWRAKRSSLYRGERGGASVKEFVP